MKKHNPRLSIGCRILLLSAILALSVSMPTPASATVDAIIAVVNDDVITFKDLQDYLSAAYVRLRMENYPEEKIDQIMQDMQASGLQKLIQDKLVLSEAEQKEITVPEEAIDQRVKNLEDQYSSPQEFVTSLMSDGYTLTDLRNRIRDQLMIQSVIESEVRSGIRVNPQEVTAYYDTHPEEFQRPERVNLRSIYVAKTEPPTTGENKIQQAMKELQAGKDFPAVAETFSEMPSIGVIARGELRPEIESVIFALSADEISPIVEVDQGFYIFQLLGKIPAHQASLNDVKGAITEKIFQQKFKTAFGKWLDKLKKNAYIEIKE